MACIVDASMVSCAVLPLPNQQENMEFLLRSESYLAPAHIDLEVLSAMRGYWLSKQITHEQLITSMNALLELSIERVPLQNILLLQESTRYYSNLTAYDAVYVALARQANATLITGDRAMADVAEQIGIPVEFCDAVHL